MIRIFMLAAIVFVGCQNVGEKKQNETTSNDPAVIGQIIENRIKLSQKQDQLKAHLKRQDKIKQVEGSIDSVGVMKFGETFFVVGKGQWGENNDDIIVRVELKKEGDLLKLDRSNKTETCLAHNGCSKLRFKMNKNGCFCESKEDNQYANHSVTMYFLME